MPKHRKRYSLAIALISLIGFVAVAFLGYELGRYRAGYSLFDVRRADEAQQQLISQQQDQIDSLERQVAILETAREINRETYAEVESNLTQLEAQIQAQQEELGFYQGIVSPDDGTSGLRIQSFVVDSGRGELDFVLRLVLVQAIVHNDRVSGSVELTVNGLLDGEPATLDVAALADGSAEYGFRYFQALEYEVTLPVGFKAESVDVEIVPNRPSGASFVQNYAWFGE